MNTPLKAQSQQDRFALTIAGGSPAELVAVASVVIVALVAVAAMLSSTPGAREAAPAPAVMGVSVSGAVERPFHERYPVNPRGEQFDPPTF